MSSHNFKSILDGNMITDLTEGTESKYDKAPTVIEELYQEQLELLKKRKLDIEEESIFKPFEKRDDVKLDADGNLPKNKMAYVVENQDHTVFMREEEILKLEITKEREQLELDKKEMSKSLADAKKELASARKEADEIRKKAGIEIEKLKKETLEKAKTDGYAVGYEDGKAQASIEYAQKTTQGTVAVFKELVKAIEELEQSKAKLINENISQMKDISVSVAEKIIQVSLQSSGEVIKKMILTATDKILSKEWAKIYISKLDSSMLMQIDGDVMKELSHISSYLQIETIDNAEAGTCIIELPDQTIDASVTTQMKNIRNIIDTWEYGGKR